MFRCFIFLVLVISAVHFSLSATTFTPMSAYERFMKSDLVCEVSVQGSKARWWYSGGQGRIVTFYEVVPAEVFRGRLSDEEEANQHLRIALPGGVVGEIGQRVHGVPILKEGERWLVHLGPPTGPDKARGILGFERGATKLLSKPKSQTQHPPSSGDFIESAAP